MTTPNNSQVETAGPLNLLVTALEGWASSDGCTGTTPINCREDDPTDISQWCSACLVAEAAKQLRAALSGPAVSQSAFELQLQEDAERLFENLCTGDGEHSEALDLGLIKAAFRHLLTWAVSVPKHQEEK